MTQFAAIAYLVIVLLVIVFQCALIAGAPLGHLTQGGRVAGPLPLIGRLAAFISIFVLVFMGAGIASAAGLPPRLPDWSSWIALAVQLLSTVLNWITPSRPERLLWGPITTAMLLIAVYVVMTGTE